MFFLFTNAFDFFILFINSEKDKRELRRFGRIQESAFFLRIRSLKGSADYGKGNAKEESESGPGCRRES
jgi:hypothetical protein